MQTWKWSNIAYFGVFGTPNKAVRLFWGGIKSKDQNLAPNVLDSLNNLKLRLNHCELKNKLAWLSRCDGNIASLDDTYRGSLFQDCLVDPAPLYLTLKSVSQWPLIEFTHKEWLFKIGTIATFDQTKRKIVMSGLFFHLQLTPTYLKLTFLSFFLSFFLSLKSFIRNW